MHIQSYVDYPLMVSVRSPRGEIHNLRLNSGGVSSKGLSFSLCGGLLMYSCLKNLLASGVQGVAVVLSGFVRSYIACIG